MIRVISDNRLHITWDEPEELNGQLSYYKVVVYNERTRFNQTRTVMASDTRELDLAGLSKLW